MVGNLIKKWIPATITVITGMVVLLGYLIPNSIFASFRDPLIEWAIIVAAFAFILGMFNILRVHGGRLSRPGQGGIHSLVLILAALGTSVLPILESVGILPHEPGAEPSTLVFNHVIRPAGASLAALVVFTLALAAFRLLRVRRSWNTLLFVLFVALVLISNPLLEPLGEEIPSLIRDWTVNVLGMAGMRGLLLGVALGTVITALRILATIDSPYGES